MEEPPVKSMPRQSLPFMAPTTMQMSSRMADREQDQTFWPMKLMLLFFLKRFRNLRSFIMPMVSAQ